MAAAPAGQESKTPVGLAAVDAAAPMRDRAATVGDSMRISILPSLVLLGAALASAPPAIAGSANAGRPALSAPSDVSSQTDRQRRARTRITVTPRGRLVRACDFRLVREVRASGTYVVPWQRCWWTRVR